MSGIGRIKLSAFLALLFIAAAPGTAQSKTCVKWQAAMAQGRISLMPVGKNILVKPFTDFTKKPGDEWLSTGIRNFVGDLLSSAEKARAQYGITATHGGGPYDHSIDGMYQHLDGNMRIFIKLSDGGGQLIAQREVVFPYPDNSEFFSRTAQATADLMKEMQLAFDQSSFNAVKDATASTRAYESYSRGRELLEAYNASNAGAVISHFTDVKRLDYASPLGYQGIAAVNDFLGLYNKMSGKPYDTYFIRAEAEIAQMAKLTKPMSPVFGYIKPKPAAKETGPAEIKDRFVMGNAYYKEGSAAASRSDHKAAAAAFRKSVELVPEDAVAWQRLANSESILGNQEGAVQAQNRAGAIDPCLGNP